MFHYQILALVYLALYIIRTYYFTLTKQKNPSHEMNNFIPRDGFFVPRDEFAHLVGQN